MSPLSEGLVLAACLLATIAVVRVVAERLGHPELALLSLVAIGIGATDASMGNSMPGPMRSFLAPLIAPRLPADAYLALFLPPLLFQVALRLDVRSLVRDAAPILLLAVVAVFVAAGVIGLSLGLVAPQSLAVCLLLGAIVATTDPSAVVSVFADVGAPERLIRLVEGESLLNDAAAISVAGVLTASLVHVGAPIGWLDGFEALGYSFGGGLVLGAVIGRAAALALPLLGNNTVAETALTLALPYPLYLLGNDALEVSGVVAVVCAGIVMNDLGRTRLSPRNWHHLQLVWEQIAAFAGTVVFLLACVRVPHLLLGISWIDLAYLGVVVVAAFLARLLVLFLMLPVLSRLDLSSPISSRYKIVMAWGGLRGAVTLVLALGVAENAALPSDTRRFVSIVATGFVLFNLLVNGNSLRWVVRRLRLDRLSKQDQALQQQAIAISVEEVQATLQRITETFHFSRETADEVCENYRRILSMDSTGTGLLLSERQRFDIGLATLATRERDLIPDYGDGIVGVSNLDAMMRNAGHMIDAARIEGRVGYQREARRILEPTVGFRIGLTLRRLLRVDRVLAGAVADRFELLICRRAILERLRIYTTTRLQPLLGGPMAEQLQTVLEGRSRAAEDALNLLRAEYGDFTTALERRILLLFALRNGRAAMQAMEAERVISREVFTWVRQELDHAWHAAVERPTLRCDDSADAGRCT